MSLVQLRSIWETSEAHLSEEKDIASSELAAVRELQSELGEIQRINQAAQRLGDSLRIDASEAREDLSVLESGLPSLVGSRCEELRAEMALVSALTERSEHARHEEYAYSQEKETQLRSLESCRREVELWKGRTDPMPGYLKAEADAAADLEDASQRSRRRAIQHHDDAAHNERMINQIMRDIDPLTQETEDFQAAYDAAKARNEEAVAESWSQGEAFCLAQQLERQTVKRSLALTQERLRVKHRETQFWRDASRQLSNELEQTRSQKDADRNIVARQAQIQIHAARGVPS